MRKNGIFSILQTVTDRKFDVYLTYANLISIFASSYKASRLQSLQDNLKGPTEDLTMEMSGHTQDVVKMSQKSRFS